VIKFCFSNHSRLHARELIDLYRSATEPAVVVKTVLPRAAGRPDAHGNEILCHLHARTYILKSHRFIVTYNRSVCIIRDEDNIITVVVIIIIIVVYYDDITRVVGKQLSYARITRVTHKVYNIRSILCTYNVI